jgi:CRP-like cAMP-binding protein
MQNKINFSPQRGYERLSRNRSFGKTPTAEIIQFGTKTKPTENVFNQILNALPASERAIILSYAEKVDFSAGENVYQPGCDVKYIYFPETVVFSECQILEDGRTCEVAVIGNEGLIGLSHVFGWGEAMNWTEVCLAGSAYKISSDMLTGSYKSFETLRTELNKYVSQYIRQLTQRIICNCYHQIRERFCSWLLMLQDRKGDKLFLTQDQMARLIGVQRPSLSLIAKEFRDKKIISYTRGRIELLDREELIKGACSCYVPKASEVEELSVIGF